MAVSEIIPLFESYDLNERQGATECISWITSSMDLDVVPYITLLMVPVLGRMSDQNEDIRLVATNTFATLIIIHCLSIKDYD